MAYKIIEIFVGNEFFDEIEKIIKKREIINCWKINNENEKIKYSILLEEKNVEMIVDNISKVLNFADGVHEIKDITNIMVLTPVEAFLPKVQSIEENKTKANRKNKLVDRISTEEMYDDVHNGSRITQNFLLNVILASVVCSVGIIQRDISILIASSAIAPFLGSIMAYSFSLSIGDNELKQNSIKTLLFGIILSIVIGIIIGFLWNYLPNTYKIDIGSNIFHEMNVNQYTFILALASGASAGLAITAGTPTLMASFMISVSLLPNMTITGITLGNGFYKLFLNSVILLFINLFCILFASQIIFAFKKIKPKTKKAFEIYKNNNIMIIVYCIFIILILIILKLLLQNNYSI